MSLWEVERRGRVKVYSVERLRRKLALGKLSAESRVRPLGGDAWRPLREVTELGRPPETLAGGTPDEPTRWAMIQGMLWHGVVYGSVVYFVHLPRIAAIIWGFAVFSHVASTLPRLFARRRPAIAAGAETQRAGAATTAPPVPAPERDPFLAELATAIADLEQIASSRQLAGVDLAALRASAEDLRKRHLQLASLADAGALARLGAERDRAEAQAAAATDPRTVEALQEQARSVAERLASLAQAGEAAARLEARERTLLHQVESLRLELARSSADEAAPTDLAAEVKRLQADVQATAEVEAHLARARLGARAAQKA